MTQIFIFNLIVRSISVAILMFLIAKFLINMIRHPARNGYSMVRIALLVAFVGWFGEYALRLVGDAHVIFGNGTQQAFLKSIEWPLLITRVIALLSLCVFSLMFLGEKWVERLIRRIAALVVWPFYLVRRALVFCSNRDNRS